MNTYKRGFLVYLDDILIYTKTKVEHVKLVRVVLNTLCAIKLYAKLSKCEFHKDYLGYQISHEGVEMDPERVRAVIKWVPSCTKATTQLLWLCKFL